jgi:hypothetical protein
MELHPKKLESIINTIREIANLSKAYSTTEAPSHSPWLRFFLDGRAVVLREKSLDSYQELIKQILNKAPFQWSRKFTEKKVVTLIRGLIVLALSDDKNDLIEYKFKQALTEYDSINKEIRSFLPISGLVIESSIEIGRLILHPATKSFKKQVFEHIVGVIKKTTESQENKDKYGKDLEKDLDNIFKHPTIVEFSAIAHPDRAQELLEAFTREALDVVIAALPLIARENTKPQIGIGDEIAYSSLPIVSIAEESANLSESRIGPFAPVQLNNAAIETMKKHGLWKSFEFQALDDLTELQRKYLQCIHWLADSNTQKNPANKLLSLSTCLEIFLSPPKMSDVSISNAISEGYALLFVEGFESRKIAKKRIKELYGKRSRLTHGAGAEILDQDIYDLRVAVFNILQHVFDNLGEYKSAEDIQQRIEELRLS